MVLHILKTDYAKLVPLVKKRSVKDPALFTEQQNYYLADRVPGEILESIRQAALQLPDSGWQDIFNTAFPRQDRDGQGFFFFATNHTCPQTNHPDDQHFRQ